MARRPFNLVVVAAVAGLAAPASADQFDVRLLSRTVRSEIIDPNLVRAVRGATDVTRAVVRFERRLTTDERDAIEAVGIRFLSSLGNNGFIASIPPRIDLERGPLVAAQGVLEQLRGADLLGSADRLAGGLAGGGVPPPWSTTRSGTPRVLVQFHEDVDLADANAIVGSVNATGRHFGSTSWVVFVDPNQLRALAAKDGVKRVEPGPPRYLQLSSRGRLETRTDAAQRASFYPLRPHFELDASAVKIGIFDSGIDHHHPDFDEVTSSGVAGNSRVNPQRPGSSHGTFVASIAAGSGLNSSLHGWPAFARRGHAPYAQIGDYPQVVDPNGGGPAVLATALLAGVRVSNHSYVQSLDGTYDVMAAVLDLIVRGDATLQSTAVPASPQVWAAGNNGFNDQFQTGRTGYYSVYTSAKNTISVGAIDTVDGHLSQVSSLGPTPDGRIKPDLVAPGCQSWSSGDGIYGAEAVSHGYNFLSCSTSAAAPAVTGAIAMMMHQLTSVPSLASTYKAVLIQTADDRIKTEPAAQEFNNPDTTDPVLYHRGPDYATGWGMVDARSARRLIVDPNHWGEDVIEETGFSDDWCLRVSPGAAELKVTIAWDDLPGNTSNAIPGLVNDLDLEIVDPNGSSILPWTLPPGEGESAGVTSTMIAPARRGEDHKNNVEMATYFTPPPGQWRARITGFDLTSSQAYSMATSHPIVVCQ